MALYRFLFAPALLAVAVLAGPGGEREQVVEADPPRIVAPARVAAPPAPPAPSAPLERVAAKHAAKRASSARH
jgi:hypothetical protein